MDGTVQALFLGLAGLAALSCVLAWERPPVGVPMDRITSTGGVAVRDRSPPPVAPKYYVVTETPARRS